MGLVVTGVILYILISMFSDSPDTSNRWKILGIVVAMAIIEGVASAKLPGTPWAFGILGLSTAAVATLLVVWCSISVKAAIKIAVIFVVVRLAIAVAMSSLVSQTQA